MLTKTKYFFLMLIYLSSVMCEAAVFFEGENISVFQENELLDNYLVVRKLGGENYYYIESLQSIDRFFELLDDQIYGDPELYKFFLLNEYKAVYVKDGQDSNWALEIGEVFREPEIKFWVPYKKGDVFEMTIK